MEYRVSEIAAAVGGKLLWGDPDLAATGVSIDTRTLSRGDVFFAIIGERVDGHGFLGEAASKGAHAAVVQREVACNGLPAILVADTALALTRLAHVHRTRHDVRVVAVTGSSGKTTTKDMIAAVLRRGFVTLSTLGNLNNEYGLPLTLLRLQEGHEAAVVEMGMRGPGQIKALSSIALPDIGVVTNVGDAHIELLGSRENIARAKGELIEALPEDGIAVLNGDDTLVRPMSLKHRGRSVFYGIGDGNHVQACDIRTWASGSSFLLAESTRLPNRRVSEPFSNIRFNLPLPGRHNIMNALAAISVGLALGLDCRTIAEGLGEFEPSPMRMHLVSLQGDILVVDDTYNANPDSMRAAIEATMSIASGKPVIAVLGGMLELGDWAYNAHIDVGRAVVESGVSALITVGDLGAFLAEGARKAGMAQVRAVASHEEAVEAVRDLAPTGAVVVVKGSRGTRMDKVVTGLKAAMNGDENR